MAGGIKRTVGLSITLLSRTLKILDKLEKSKAIDRMLEMLTKVEKSVDKIDRLMTLLESFEILSAAFADKKKKTKKKHR